METTIRRGDDFHAHLREGEMLEKVLLFSNFWGRVTVMGNLSKPVATAHNVIKYRNKILQLNPKFIPIMSAMLVNSATAEILRKTFEAGAKVLKLIPGGTSTNSNEGVSLENLHIYYPVLEEAQKLGMIFSGHWELATDPLSGEEIPEVEREERAMPYLEKIIESFPNLKIIVEHATTKRMIEFVKDAPANVASTLTVHHALLTYNKVYHCDGINPFNYCKPVAKFVYDRKAIVEAMISGNPKFFFGSDSAPHLPERKRGQNPAAGIFTPAEVALTVLTEIFDSFGALSELENFISMSGAEFYDLPLNKDFITLRRKKWTVPKDYNGIVPFMAGHELGWKVEQ